MNIKELMIGEKSRLITLINKLKNDIEHLPKGSFYISSNGKYTKWYSTIDGKKVLIKKSDKQLAGALASKKFAEFRLKNVCLF